MQNEIRLGNIKSCRDWACAKDYVKYIHKILQLDKPNDFVLATGETYSVEQFLQKSFQYLGMDYEKYLKVDEKLYRPNEVPFLLGYADKAKRMLGFKVETKLEDLIKIMIEYDLEKEGKEND